MSILSVPAADETEAKRLGAHYDSSSDSYQVTSGMPPRTAKLLLQRFPPEAGDDTDSEAKTQELPKLVQCQGTTREGSRCKITNLSMLIGADPLREGMAYCTFHMHQGKRKKWDDAYDSADKARTPSESSGAKKKADELERLVDLTKAYDEIDEVPGIIVVKGPQGHDNEIWCCSRNMWYKCSEKSSSAFTEARICLSRGRSLGCPSSCKCECMSHSASSTRAGTDGMRENGRSTLQTGGALGRVARYGLQFSCWQRLCSSPSYPCTSRASISEMCSAFRGCHRHSR